MTGDWGKINDTLTGPPHSHSPSPHVMSSTSQVDDSAPILKERRFKLSRYSFRPSPIPFSNSTYIELVIGAGEYWREVVTEGPLSHPSLDTLL